MSRGAMNIWGWVRLGVLKVLVSALSLVAATRVNASPATLSGSPDALFGLSTNAAALVPPAPPLALSAAVPAPTPRVVPDSPAHVVRGQAALARIGYDLSSLGYTISFHPGDASHLGLTFTRPRHIEIYVRPSMSDGELAYVIGHEMGHAVDHILNTGADRQAWAGARGIGSLPWWPVDVGSDLATPAGDFAECFASWAAGSASHSAWGSCGPVMTLMAELARE